MKTNPFQSGINDTLKIISSWKSQTNPPKVYVLGKRVHHGPVFALLALAGIYYKDPYLVGAGIAGALDDVDDIDHWLDFEVGGDPNSLVDVV